MMRNEAEQEERRYINNDKSGRRGEISHLMMKVEERSLCNLQSCGTVLLRVLQTRDESNSIHN